MGRLLLSYTLIRHLKFEKCLIGNCRLCYNIRKNVICRHITDSAESSNRQMTCSQNENKHPLSLGSHKSIMKQQQQDLDDSCSHGTEHIYGHKQESAEFLASGTSEDGEQLEHMLNSVRMFKLLKKFEINGKQCVGKLLHKALWKLKEKQLLSDQELNDIIKYSAIQANKNTLHLQETVNLPKRHESSMISDSVLLIKGKLDTQSSPTTKEIFNYNMFIKYQNPTLEEANRLSAMFPEPKKLISAVVLLFLKADESYSPRLVVTDHLKGRIWKAHLTLIKPHELTVRGVHPDKDLAIHGAYLHMCEYLKNMGLIYQSKDGSWMPMTCDKVISMLDTLAKYGQSSFGCSRGKGIKIILEQVKEEKGCDTVTVCDRDSDINNRLNNMKEKLQDKHLGNSNKDKAEFCEVKSEYPVEKKNIWNTETFAIESSVLQKSRDTTGNNRLVRDSGEDHRSKSRWICTIHVGWPFPFSIQAEGLSLPAAQTLGYISVVSKLKAKGLLTPSNRSISRQQIEHSLIVHTRKHWEGSIRMLVDKTTIEKFDADAEIFCDASRAGFGAFLLLDGIQKVSWLSEDWKDHMVNRHHLIVNNDRHLHTMFAEMFALVTTVFTWKHKLRGRRLLCINDNMMVLGLINAFLSEPLKGDNCRDPLDHLIHILQTTCHEYNIKLQATWVDREENWLADCLSRNDIHSFQLAITKAAIHKTKAKKLKIRQGTCI